MTWWWRNLFFSYLRARFSEELQRKWMWKTVNVIVKKTNRQQFSMVCALMDHRNDVKMYKTLQWNHSFWVLIILTSFLWSIELQTMGNCWLDLLIRSFFRFCTSVACRNWALWSRPRYLELIHDLMQNADLLEVWQISIGSDAVTLSSFSCLCLILGLE